MHNRKSTDLIHIDVAEMRKIRFSFKTVMLFGNDNQQLSGLYFTQKDSKQYAHISLILIEGRITYM